MDTTRGTKRSREEDGDDADVGAVRTEAEQEGFADLPDDILRRIMSCGDFADRSRLRCCCRSLKRVERDLPPPDWVVVNVFERKEEKRNCKAEQPWGFKTGDSVVRINIGRDRTVLRLSGIRPERLEVNFITEGCFGIGWGPDNHASMAKMTNDILKHASEQVRALFLNGIASDVDIFDGLSALRHTVEAMRVGGRKYRGHDWESSALFRSMYSLSGLKHLNVMSADSYNRSDRTNVRDFAALLERLPNLEHFGNLDVDPIDTSWLPYWKRVKENRGCEKLRSLSVRIYNFEHLEALASTIRNHFPSLQHLSIYCEDNTIFNISEEEAAVLKKFDFLKGISIDLLFDNFGEDDGAGGAQKSVLSVLRDLPNLRDGLRVKDPSQWMWNSVHEMGGHKLRGIEITVGEEDMEAIVNGLIGAFPALECVRFEQNLNCTAYIHGDAAVAAEWKKNSDALLLLGKHPTLHCIILEQYGADGDEGGERCLQFLSENLPNIRVIDGRTARTANDYLEHFDSAWQS